jgi:dihydrofolate synthase/folylpolyglutamate synthase
LAAALAALMVLNPAGMYKTAEIATAIRNCVVPGRLQRLATAPEILLDVGHNELAAEVLAAFLQDSGRSQTSCVLAMLADKSAEAVASAMGDRCKHWYCADSPGARGQSGARLAERVKSALPMAEVSVFGPVDDAMRAALARADAAETILVFGSFTTVAAAAQWLQKHVQRDARDAVKITRDKSAVNGLEKANG